MHLCMVLAQPPRSDACQVRGAAARLYQRCWRYPALGDAAETAICAASATCRVSANAAVVNREH
jgi:hypothetical protein